MLLLEGVEVHVREDAFKSCLRRHMDWLDELVIDADDNTWFRWMSQRQTKDQSLQTHQMSGDGSETLDANQPKTGQKRRFEVQSRTRTVAQNVLKAVKCGRRGAAVPGALPQQRVQQSQTVTAGSSNFNTQFQQQRTPSRTRQLTRVKPAPSGGESPRILLQSEINLKPSVTNVVSQQQLNESENVVSSIATAPVSSESAETVNFTVLDSNGCEILSSVDIESTLESIKNAEEESDDSMIPDDSNDAASTNKNETNVEQPSGSGLSTPPLPAVSSCDYKLEQLESIVSSSPSFEQFELFSGAANPEKVELKYSEQLTDTNAADINTLPVQQSHHHQGYGSIKNEPMKIEPVEISSGSDNDEDYSTQQIVQQQHDPQPGTSGAFDQSDSRVSASPPWEPLQYEGVTIEGSLSRSNGFRSKSQSKPMTGGATGGDSMKYKCQLCRKGFIRPSDRTQHERIHIGYKPFKCPTCERGFKRKAHCDLHIKRIHTNDRPFKCQFCEKAYASIGEKNQHAGFEIGPARHLGKDAYNQMGNEQNMSGTATSVPVPETVDHQRSTRERQCLASKDLNWHNRRIHTDEKPFKRPTCEQRFNDESSCRRHRKSFHIDEKLFKCQFCDKSFGTRAQFIKHKRIHTGEKPYKCRKCELRFTQKGNCKQHMLAVHKNEKLFECSTCGRRFNRKYHCKQHIERVHNNSISISKKTFIL
ncbi:uncharacterized protein LOC141910368 [Tubulanus polymorphus]|uniref:uncharacterized protein LOC141910368 n=1 Tax=Tubulanus polymorphus TaxID=672921 RepID=UPI003DA6811A